MTREEIDQISKRLDELEQSLGSGPAPWLKEYMKDTTVTVPTAVGAPKEQSRSDRELAAELIKRAEETDAALNRTTGADYPIPRTGLSTDELKAWKRK
jgi:hypothetical protein